MRHIYAYALVAALLIGLATGWYRTGAQLAATQVSRDAYADALKQAGKQRARDAALLAARAKAAAAAQREAQLLRLRLNDALAANREWAGQPVPVAVQQALEQQ